MEQINGYFRIMWQGNVAICQVYAPKKGGMPITYKEVSNYLAHHGIGGFTEHELHTAIASNKDCRITLCQGDGIEISESMDSVISLDKMKITCRFTPPSEGGNLLTERDIITDLTSMGVKFGIKEDVIAQFMESRVYGTDIVLVEGVQPRHGMDARIEYFFNTNTSLKPKHNEDGTVDYHSLNNICPVEAGQLLARLHPIDPGEPGQDVFGRRIPPRNVRNRSLEYGLNITRSEDGTEIFSDVTGHVTLKTGKVFVSNVYEVPADVDSSTGDIDYEGSVHVRGSVRGGFTVVAKENIVVEGSVEDAMLIAGGDIIVKRGIVGKQKGYMEAQGNVITKYIENAKISAGGYVETGSIIYSEVGAGEDVIVADKKGFINGGTIRASGRVEANTIGSTMGSKTTIEVGMNPERKERYSFLLKTISAGQEEINRIKPVLDKYKQVIASGAELDAKNRAYFLQLSNRIQEIEAESQEYTQEFNDLRKELLAGQHAKIIVRRDIYPGVELNISDTLFYVKDKRSFCSIERKNGEISFLPL